MGRQLDQFRCWLTLLAFAVWFGGFTFYAAVVVPLGSEVTDATTQGFVTQRVTHRLNAMGGVALFLLAWQIASLPSRRRRNWLIWAVMAVSWLGLLVLHPVLDGLLDAEGMAVDEALTFYRWHQAYLWLSVVQWLGCLAIVPVVLRPAGSP